MRSVQRNITGLPRDFFATSPWRAPGTAPVLGSGCGVGGGSIGDIFMNGGWLGKSSPYPQGMDGAKLPKTAAPAEVWTRGGTAEVAFALVANHGGGYSYRLCPADGEVNEKCFQAHQLDFAGKGSEIVYTNGTRTAIPRRTTREGTFPAGSEWARNPVPSCRNCDSVFDQCGAPLPMVPGPIKNFSDVTDPVWVWERQVACMSKCITPFLETGDDDDGHGVINRCKGQTQFPEPAPGISGWGGSTLPYPNWWPYPSADTVNAPDDYGWKWSVADKVAVPRDLKPGNYLLSWRWDSEASTQVWQNCADVTLV